jgi:8-oxo-dGTP diphosphatase
MLVRPAGVLLCHRSIDRAWYPGRWDLPGGHIESNETPKRALGREMREELGIALAEPLGDHSFYRATGEFEMRVWVLRSWGGSPSNCAPEEHDDVGWFSAEDVLSLRLADPQYGDWITEALAAAAVGPDTRQQRM